MTWNNKEMFKNSLVTAKEYLSLCVSFISFLFFYFQKKIHIAGLFFEQNKNILVKFFLMKRGRYNRPFLHLSAMGLLVAGVIIAPFLADTYPIFSNNRNVSIASAETSQSVESVEDVFATSVSQKPRDKIVNYVVEKGDTLSTIAQKFGVSSDTIRWGNNLFSDDLTVGDELKILPVTGMSHKVAKGDTVYSIAKKYDTEAQKIVDFPFNDFANPETFSLVEGQMLVVPDGVKPSEQKTFKREVFIARGPAPDRVYASGFTWPLNGVISQFAAWYHMAIDITSPVGTPVVAAQNGKIVKAVSGAWDGGYGNNVEIDNGGGYSSLYAHMQSLNVGVGDEVVAGKTVVGFVGLTGRTTGAHLHFEIRKNGVLVDPLSYLQ